MDFSKLDKLIDLLTPKAEPEKAELEVETKEDIDSALEELDETGEEAAVVAAEEMDACGEKSLDSAMQRAILKTVREAVAGIKDDSDRKAVTDAVLKAVRTKKSDLEGILNSKYAPKSKDTNEDIQARYAAMNPHKN